MKMNIFDKQIDQEYERAKNSNDFDYQMMLQETETRAKIERQRKEELEKQKTKINQRKLKADQNRLLCEEEKKDRINKLKQRREFKDSQLNNRKKHQIISKTFITHIDEIEEDKERLRNKLNQEIISTIQSYSDNHNNHIKEIENKSVAYYQHVMEKHDKYWAERKVNNDDIRNEIDLINAKKFHTYQKFMYEKGKQYEYYYDQRKQKELMADNNKRDMNNFKDENLKKMVNQTREGGNMSQRTELTSRQSTSNKNQKTTKEKFDEREIMTQKQYENKLKIDNEKIIINEKILQEEYDLFKKISDEELKRERNRQRSQINTIRIQEDKDRKIDDLNDYISKLKNKSIYKRDVSNLNKKLEL